VGLGGRSSTFCEVGRREVSGQSDSEGEVRLRDPRPEKKKKKKNVVGLRRDPARFGEARPWVSGETSISGLASFFLLLLSSLFFFLSFSLFFSLVFFHPVIPSVE
jgi:hypothetical protein